MSQSPASNVPEGNNKGLRAEAGVAGASGGSLLAGLAQLLLPEKSPWKPALVLIAPGVSVALSAVWYEVRKRVRRYFRQRDLTVKVERMRRTLEAIIDNPRISQEDRDDARQRLEQLNRVKLQLDWDHLQALIEKTKQDQ